MSPLSSYGCAVVGGASLVTFAQRLEYDNRDGPVVEVADLEDYGSQDISADLTVGS